MKSVLAAAILLVLPVAALVASAYAEEATPVLTVAHGQFEPSQVTVPAGTPLTLHLTNQDQAAIEFESFELHRERVVEPGQTITVRLPSLSPGAYSFIDDFHRETPELHLVAR